MKKTNYPLLFIGMILFSCAVPKIGYKAIDASKAKSMYEHYFDSTSSADHSLLAIPKVIIFNKKELKMFGKGTKIQNVKFLLAAYLPGETIMTPNMPTVLFQKKSVNHGDTTLTYYDLRQPATLALKEITVCPKPDDCKAAVQN